MRIDLFLADKFGSRTKAATAINKGLVKVNGRAVAPSYDFKDSDAVEFFEAENYVSAGGFKLAKAFNDFGESVKGKIYADLGASTGGFTDCLFQHGAKKVYCIDVGESQLDKSLLNKNVKVIDNYNARNLNCDVFEDRLDGIVIDVSFISLTYILGAAASVLEDGCKVFALIKPQFECDCKRVGKNGIVRDEQLRKRAIVKVLEFAKSVNLAPERITCAPIIKGKNVEYVAMFKKGGAPSEINNLLKAVNF